jgi:hypothetical protein
MSALSLVAAQELFTAHLSAVEDAARFAFRRLRPQEYEEKVAEARAAAWSAWHGLLRRGKDPRAVGVHGIATNAIRYVKNGRKLGCGTAGRGAMDVYNPKVHREHGLRVIPFEEVAGAPAGSWQDWLAEDNRVSPADEAAFRIDFESWLAGLPTRKRQIAELMAEGHEGIVVARMLGCSPGRVSQVRTELEASWEAFQAEPVTA